MAIFLKRFEPLLNVDPYSASKDFKEIERTDNVEHDGKEYQEIKYKNLKPHDFCWKITHICFLVLAGVLLDFKNAQRIWKQIISGEEIKTVLIVKKHFQEDKREALQEKEKNDIPLATKEALLPLQNELAKPVGEAVKTPPPSKHGSAELLDLDSIVDISALEKNPTVEKLDDEQYDILKNLIREKNKIKDVQSRKIFHDLILKIMNGEKVSKDQALRSIFLAVILDFRPDLRNHNFETVNTTQLQILAQPLQSFNTKQVENEKSSERRKSCFPERKNELNIINDAINQMLEGKKLSHKALTKALEDAAVKKTKSVNFKEQKWINENKEYITGRVRNSVSTGTMNIPSVVECEDVWLYEPEPDDEVNYEPEWIAEAKDKKEFRKSAEYLASELAEDELAYENEQKKLAEIAAKKQKNRSFSIKNPFKSHKDKKGKKSSTDKRESNTEAGEIKEKDPSKIDKRDSIDSELKEEGSEIKVNKNFLRNVKVNPFAKVKKT